MSKVKSLSDPVRPPDHLYPWRVAYADTDAGGVVYHSRYIEWAERARAHWTAEIGVSTRKFLEEDGMALAIRRIEAEYRAPAFVDDELEIRTWLEEVGGASMQFRHNIVRFTAPPGGGAENRRKNSGNDLNFVTLMALDLTVVCVKVSGEGAGKAVRAPEAFRVAAAAAHSTAV
ncbi:MAG: YbgC/FadM family acyl-CoA thioesterase [Rhodospirillales bacterium]